MLRRTKPDEIPMELLYPVEDDVVLSDATVASAANSSSSNVAGKPAGGPAGSRPPQAVTVDLINEMIRRKPDNVGAALKNYVGEEKPTDG
jgi:hypothetical protein